MADKENGLEDAAAGTVEATVAEAAGADAPQAADLTALLEDARSKADAHWDQCLRLQAELDNLRKRSERDLANAHKFALERFAAELLPVRDSMEMGLAAFDAEGGESGKQREGVELTLQMLTSAMAKFQIQEVNPENQPFNPDFHQAMSIQERADVAPNTVVTVVQKGYTLNDRLLRPAMVIVAKAPAAG
ncbi:MAG: nucleotide exchange factor GrpE [Pseudomonadota bacterium]